MNDNTNPMPDPAWPPEEVEKLWDNCYSKLLYIAYVITNDQETARDIVMQNLMKVIEGRSGITPTGDPCDRLRVWVSNDSKTYLTRKKRADNRNEVFYEKYYTEADPDTEKEMIRAEIFQRLKKEIDKLPTECSKVIKLELKGLNIKAIALQLNKKERTVRSHKSRGYQLLRERLGGADLFPLVSILIYFHNGTAN